MVVKLAATGNVFELFGSNNPCNDLEIIGYGFVSFSFKESKILIRKGARDIKDGTAAA